MVDGFTIPIKGGSFYELRFVNRGKVEKLISITITKMLDSSTKPAHNDNLVKN
jgi:hypothetical protein